jgi:AraC-like DNA-binding protein
MIQLHRRISTTDVAPESAAGYFTDILSKSNVPCKFSAINSKNFSGWIEEYDLGPLMLCYGQGRSFLAERLDLTRSIHSNYLSLIFARRGLIDIIHDRRKIQISSGQCIIIDGEELVIASSESEFEGTCAIMDKKWLQNWLGPIDHFGLRPLSRQSGWDLAIQSFMCALTRESLATLSIPPEILAEQIAAITALACGPASHSSLRSHKTATLRRARQVMREHFHEQNFDPTKLAAELGVSKRYLYALFAETESSVCDELMDLRLSRARSYLTDPRYDAKTIAEIAFLVGFATPSHFSRCFRQRFGLTPSTCRAVGQTETGSAPL